MKKIVLLIAACCCFAIQLFAQDHTGKSRITAGIGFVSAQDIFDLLSTLVISESTLGEISATTTTSIPSVYLEYSHFLNDRIRVDVNANYAYNKQDWQFTSDGSSAGTFKTSFYTLMVGGHYDWMKNNRLVQLHSGLYLGGSLLAGSTTIDNTSASDDFAFAYQIDALGIRIGHQIAFEIDFGLGYKGLVSAGISAQF